MYYEFEDKEKGCKYHILKNNFFVVCWAEYCFDLFFSSVLEGFG